MAFTTFCSPGSQKIKGTDYGIYPMFDNFYDLLPGHIAQEASY